MSTPLQAWKTTRIHIVFIIFTIQLLAGTGRAEIWKSQQLNCQIILPSGEGWKQMATSVPLMKIAVSNPAEAKTITLFAGDAPKDSKTLENFLPGFKASWFNQGVSTGRSESALQIDGREARQLNDTVAAQGMQFQRVTILIIDQGKLYQIAAMSGLGHSVNELDIQESLKSFHFLNRVSKQPVNAPSKYPASGMAGRIGSITGFALIVIAAVVLAIRTSARRKPKL